MTYMQFSLINDGIDQRTVYNKIIESNKIEVDKMMDLGYKIFYSMSDSLLNDTTYLTKRSGVTNGLKDYQKAYDKYNKLYSKLNSSEKEQIDSRIQGNKQYINTFWANSSSYAKMVTPEHLTKTINNRIMNEALKNSNQYFYGRSNNLSRITSLMDIDEVVSFYKNAQKRLAIYNKNNPQFDENLQLTFAMIIRGKIKNVVVNSQTSEVTEENIKKDKIELAAIIYNVMKETPINPELVHYINIYDSKEISDKMVSDYDIKKEAKRKIHNMNGFNKTVAKVTGRWKKCMKILEQEKLTEKDIESLSRL